MYSLLCDIYESISRKRLKHLITCGFGEIHDRLDRMELFMSELGTQLDDTLTQLGTAVAEQTTAITELSDRITNLPDASDITQEDIDALKAAVSNVKENSDQINALAVASPQIPTPEEPETPTEPQPVDENGNPIPTPPETPQA